MTDLIALHVIFAGSLLLSFVAGYTMRAMLRPRPISLKTQIPLTIQVDAYSPPMVKAEPVDENIVEGDEWKYGIREDQ